MKSIIFIDLQDELWTLHFYVQNWGIKILLKWQTTTNTGEGTWKEQSFIEQHHERCDHNLNTQRVVWENELKDVLLLNTFKSGCIWTALTLLVETITGQKIKSFHLQTTILNSRFNKLKDIVYNLMYTVIIWPIMHILREYTFILSISYIIL